MNKLDTAVYNLGIAHRRVTRIKHAIERGEQISCDELLEAERILIAVGEELNNIRLDQLAEED